MAREVERLSGIICQDAVIVFQCIQGVTLLRGRSSPSVSHAAFTNIRLSHERLCPTHNQFKFIGHSVATGMSSSQGRWPGCEICVFARKSCLSGFGGKHTLRPGGYPCIYASPDYRTFMLHDHSNILLLLQVGKNCYHETSISMFYKHL